jgi:hypothetical protein
VLFQSRPVYLISTISTSAVVSPKLEKFLESLSPQKAQQVRASADSFFWDDVPVFED